MPRRMARSTERILNVQAFRDKTSGELGITTEKRQE